jgi:CRISPR-associated Csh1 family protein
MIKSFYTIGNILRKDETYAQYFEPWSNPFPKVKDDEAKVVFAEIYKDVLQENLKEENFSKKKINSYLYREVQGSNGTNLVPTLLLQIDSNYNKYSDNVGKLIKKIKKSVQNYKHSFISLAQIDEIKQKLLQYHRFMNPDKRYLFTIKIDEKYFGDFDDYKNLFKESAYSKYYKDSSSKDKLCAVTYKQSDEVWGRVDILGFTVDAMAFSRNGFEPKDSYKMFPVSPDAVKVLEGSKRIILESNLNLTSDFFKLKYCIIPHFIVNDEKIINRVVQSFFQTANEKRSLESEGESIIYNEKLLYRIVEKYELQNSVYYDIFFFQKNQKQFLIKLHLSDVLPSRFKAIFDTKYKVENKYKFINRIFISKDKNSGKTPKDYKINFGGLYEQKMPPMYGIKDYFSKKVRTDIVFHPYFFKILEAVFYGNPLNKETILKAFMEKIITAFNNVKENPYDFARHIKTSFTIYQFFNELRLFNSNTMEENTTQNNDSVSLNLKGFIEQNNDFFPDNEPVKKGAFYLGCLTEKMLSTQKSYYKFDKPYQEPFLKHLRNLNFDVKELLAISNKLNTFHKYQSILKNYDFKEITELQEKAEQCLIAPTKLSRTELSYSFTLGMAMQREFVKNAIERSRENKQKSKEKTP